MNVPAHLTPASNCVGHVCCCRFLLFSSIIGHSKRFLSSPRQPRLSSVIGVDWFPKALRTAELDSELSEMLEKNDHK